MSYRATKQFARVFRKRSKYGPGIDSAITRVYHSRRASEQDLIRLLLDISRREEAKQAFEVRYNLLGKNGPFTRTIVFRIQDESEEELKERIRTTMQSYSSQTSGSGSLVDLFGLELEPRSFSITFLYRQNESKK